MTEAKPTTDSPTSLMDDSEEPASDCETPVTPSKGNEQEATAVTESSKESPETPGEKEEEKKEQQVDGKTEDEKEKAAADEKAKAEEEAKRKEKYKDWPMKNIVEPHDNDVLYGRGGGTNHHPGNKRYRQLVEDRKLDYVNSKRLDKPLVALDIIREWRSQEPPGRFLKLDEKTKKWQDVGDKKAREKTSQALREKAPLIRKQLEEDRLAKEREEHGEDSEGLDDGAKTTRFAEGTNLHDGGREGGPTKAVLARDHSLGREYMEPDEAVTIRGFSWQDPFRSGASTNSPDVTHRVSSQGSYAAIPQGGFPPDARMGSQGSMGGGPFRYPSHGSMGGPPMLPQGTYAQGDDRHYRYTTSGRYESWGNGMPPPPMPGYGYPQPQHSGSGWGEREHSLGQNPLPHASIGHPAHYSTFDSRGGSGQWGPPPNGYPTMPVSPPYNYSGGVPPDPYAAPGRDYSGGLPMMTSPTGREYSGGPPAMPSPPNLHKNSPSGSSQSGTPTSPRFEVDPAVASTWSGQDPEEIAKSLSGSSGEADRTRVTSPRADKKNKAPKDSTRPKPDLVKRATSNQNETLETKPDLKGPSVKRAALNRDNSMASNRLKEKYLPDYYQMKQMNHDREMRMLSDDLEKSTLNADDNSGGSLAKPEPLTQQERVTTIDKIAMDLMVKPEALSASTRSSTLDALALEWVEEDPWERPGLISRTTTTDEILGDLKESLARPPALTADDRLTTSEMMLMINGPINDDDTELVSGKRCVV